MTMFAIESDDHSVIAVASSRERAEQVAAMAGREYSVVPVPLADEMPVRVNVYRFRADVSEAEVSEGTHYVARWLDILHDREDLVPVRWTWTPTSERKKAGRLVVVGTDPEKVSLTYDSLLSFYTSTPDMRSAQRSGCEETPA